MIQIIVQIILCLMSAIIGAVWIQTKETKMGIEANFICNKCKATGCQAKWCKERRNKNV